MKAKQNGALFDPGSGNVFADVELPSPNLRLLKAQLMQAIQAALRDRNLTQTEAAELVGLKQSELSRIVNGRGEGFSSDRLVDVLEKLGKCANLVFLDPSETPRSNFSDDRLTRTAPMEQKIPTAEALEACLGHARHLLDSAKVLYDAGKPNIAYHLAALALEEIGRRELLGIQIASAKRPVPPAWPMKQMQNHRDKLRWGLFGGFFGTQPLTKEILQELPLLADSIHRYRLAGLYVDVNDDGLNIPSDAIPPAQAQNLINLTATRLGMTAGEVVTANVTDAELELQDWFIATAFDKSMRNQVFSASSMEKLAELGGKDWIKWLKERVDGWNAVGLAMTQAELDRSKNLPENSDKLKWKLRVRFVSESHVVRPKALTQWNSGIDWIKLTPSAEKNELIVDFYFPETIGVQSLWWPGWFLARKFAVALNIGTRGLWWWHLPEFRSRYYDTLNDLENNAAVNLDISPRLKIDWGRNVLDGQAMSEVSKCFLALPDPNDTDRLPPIDYYCAGTNFLALNDVHWRCEIQAYGNFHESLKAMVRFTGDWDGTTAFVAFFEEFLNRALPQLTPDQLTRYVNLARAIETNADPGDPFDLSDVAVIKIVCDHYFSGRVAAVVLQNKFSSASLEQTSPNS